MESVKEVSNFVSVPSLCPPSNRVERTLLQGKTGCVRIWSGLGARLGQEQTRNKERKNQENFPFSSLCSLRSLWLTKKTDPKRHDKHLASGEPRTTNASIGNFEQEDPEDTENKISSL